MSSTQRRRDGPRSKPRWRKIEEPKPGDSERAWNGDGGTGKRKRGGKRQHDNDRPRFDMRLWCVEQGMSLLCMHAKQRTGA